MRQTDRRTDRQQLRLVPLIWNTSVTLDYTSVHLLQYAVQTSQAVPSKLFRSPSLWCLIDSELHFYTYVVYHVHAVIVK